MKAVSVEVVAVVFMTNQKNYVAHSVTILFCRFGKLLTSLLQFFEGLLRTFQNFEPSLGNIFAIGLIFDSCK